MTRQTIEPDQWWTPDLALNGETAPRRVLKHANGFVMYSDGSRKVKECTEAQWDNWVHKFQCRPNRYAKRA